MVLDSVTGEVEEMQIRMPHPRCAGIATLEVGNQLVPLCLGSLSVSPNQDGQQPLIPR